MFWELSATAVLFANFLEMVEWWYIRHTWIYPEKREFCVRNPAQQLQKSYDFPDKVVRLFVENPTTLLGLPLYGFRVCLAMFVEWHTKTVPQKSVTKLLGYSSHFDVGRLASWKNSRNTAWGMFQFFFYGRPFKKTGYCQDVLRVSESLWQSSRCVFSWCWNPIGGSVASGLRCRKSRRGCHWCFRQ